MSKPAISRQILTYRRPTYIKKDVSFTTDEEFSEHFNLEHLTTAHLLECKQCNVSFDDLKLLKEHEKTNHKYQCKLCGNTFRGHAQLSAHKRLHKERPFKCDKCDKAYPRKVELDIHMRSHTGELPYACHLCDKRFAVKVRLTYHLQKHEGVTHPCSYCAAVYDNRNKLKAHLFKHTGMPYKCELCPGLGFDRRLRFANHMQRMHQKTLTEEELSAATLSAWDKILSNPSNFQQNTLESRLNKQDTHFFQQNACVNEIGHLNFKQLPSTQDIKKICEFRDAQKIQALENKHRTILAKALISYILKNNPNKKLRGEDFLQLTQCIVEIFPSELKETYYVPPQKGHFARGKLYDAYHNTRTRLRAAGVISGRFKSISPNHSTTNSVPLLSASESSSDSEEIPNSCNSQQKSHDIPESHLEQQTDNFLQSNVCVIKKEYPNIDEEFPKIKEEFPSIAKENPSIKEEYPSFSQDNNLFIPANYFQHLPSTEVIKEISEFRYVLNFPVLENIHRTTITKALIAFLLKDYPDRRLTREDFLKLAQSIVEIFPSEIIETYYVPFQKGQLAKGKLFIAYSNTRARLRATGVIPKRVLTASESHNADNSLSMLSATESSRDLDEVLSNSNDSQQNPFETSESLLKEQTTSFLQTNVGFGQLGYLNFNQPNFYQQLPTTQEIKKIWEFRIALKVPTLENKHRTNIAKGLISFILKNNPNRKLIKEDFLQLAQSVVEIFPSEIIETYYVPFEKGHLAKGKLYIAYNNIKSRLSAAGVIRRRFKSKLENPSADNSVSSLSASESNSDHEEISNTSNFLQNSFNISESMLEEQTTYFVQAQARVNETNIHNFSAVNNFCTPSKYFQQLPTTEEIRQIFVLQDALKVHTLENKHRTSIAKAIILYILKNNPDKKLTREDFLQLVQSIIEIFPSEVKETYYVPFKKGRLAKGKLYDAYNNTKSRLSAAGVIRRRVKAKTEKLAAKNVTICNTENADDLNESDFEILKSGSSEWDLVLTTWKKAHSFRQNELQTKNLSIAEYFGKYKVLFDEKNSELFDIDFKILYPTSKSIYEWKLYYHKIIQKAKPLQGEKVKELLTCIQNSDNEDSKLALSLTLVSYLLPNCRQRKKSEIQESFIFYCKDIADNEIQHRIKRLKIEAQPKVVLIGDSNDTINLAYVDICGIRLKFDNPMKAIEVCFQSFMVMNIKYPKYCSHVWIFIQKLIFKVNTPWDTVIPAINTLINDLHSADIQK